MIAYITLLITILSTVVGQVLMKKGVILSGPIPSDTREQIIYIIRSLFYNPYILGGLILAVITTISWIATISKLQLSFAYPFMSLAFPLVLVASGIFFGENISPMRWIGIMVIMIGLIIVAKY
jgi:multidrug transporter EmrE-like cation transporter